MLLRHIELHNVGCHTNLSIEIGGHLTAVVGENDVGKSVVLRAIRSTVGDQRLPADLLRAGAVEGKITLTFLVDAADTLPEQWLSGDNKDELSFYRLFPNGDCYVRAIRYADEAIDRMTAGSMTVPEQRALLKQLDISPIPVKRAEQQAALAEWLRTADLDQVEKWSPVPFNQLAEHLPRIRWASAAEMRDPSEILRSEAVDSLRAKLAEKEEVQDLIARLIRVASEEIDHFSTGVLPAIRRHLPAVQGIHMTPALEPNRLLPSVSVQIDFGTGPRDSNQIGHGSLRRMWLGLMDSRKDDAPAVKGGELWLYDEPEVALHFSAQRRLAAIFRGIGTPQSRRQTIVATHALGLIDSLRLNEVRLFELDESGGRTCIAPPDLKQAQTAFGRALGLRNSAVLFEKSVLLIEGDSEERAIPILYERLFGSEVETDGVVLLNLETCGSWRAVVKTFLKRRHDVVELLLDADCLDATSSAKIVNKAALEECGCEPDFIANHVTFVGTKEFEDAFPNSAIARVLNEHFPRVDERPWTISEIDVMKGSEKFSETIQRNIYANAIPTSRGGKGKPRFAVKLAEACLESDIPEAIVSCLNRVRERALA